MEHFGGPVAYLLDLVYRTLPPMCGAFILIDSVEIIVKKNLLEYMILKGHD